MSVGYSDLDGLVAELWSRALDNADQDPRATFFDLGGNSLQLVDLVSQLEEEIGNEIDFGDLFADPTFDTLLRLARGASGMQAASESSPA